MGENRTFSAIRSLSGLVVSSPTLILRAWVAVYAALFTAQPLDVGQQDFLSLKSPNSCLMQSVMCARAS